MYCEVALDSGLHDSIRVSRHLMDSSRAVDMPPVLTPESEKRLLRIFCFLRQHERKARIRRKRAELVQKLSCSDGGGHAAASPSSYSLAALAPTPLSWHSPPPCSSESDAVVSSKEGTATALKKDALFDQKDLLEELNRLADNTNETRPPTANSKVATPSCSPRAQAAASSTTSAVANHEKTAEAQDHLAELRREIRELEKGLCPSSPFDTSGCIAPADLVSAMKAMSRNPTKWMIWEADDDLDGAIDWHEFRSCYARSLVDKHGLEPNQLYHFTQFLLCDVDGSFTVSGVVALSFWRLGWLTQVLTLILSFLTVTVLELKAGLKKLPGTDHLASKLLVALKDDAEQQLLQKFTLSEYLDIMLADLPSNFNITPAAYKV
ncbi:hypothetical protein FI667_g386, partial [Globisporangium splendens]